MEEIKDIPGHAGKYRISNLGEVFFKRRNEWLPMKQITDRGGYKWIMLHKDGRVLNFRVHRLVLLTFVGESDLHANHKNGNKLDNRIDNLEYVTRVQNNRHSTRVLRRGNIKLKPSDIPKIRELSKSGMKQSEIGKIFNVSQGSISSILRNRTWGYID